MERGAGSACICLRPVREGFDTPDLKQARVLLDELAS
jgi:hypothetical protein